MLGLPFIAVMPRTTSAEKVAQIEFYGGEMPLRRDAPIFTRSAASSPQAWRPLHGPVHLRGAGDRLARQQQHRRVDLHSNGR